jgi:D-3-phosphoglycerate dehydrogenase
MKVLLNDGMDEEGVRLFEDAGIETDKRKRDPKSLVAQVGEFDALVVRSATAVAREVIESGVKGKLKNSIWRR